MVSGHTGNVVPGNRLRVRISCPPLIWDKELRRLHPPGDASANRLNLWHRSKLQVGNFSRHVVNGAEGEFHRGDTADLGRHGHHAGR